MKTSAVHCYHMEIYKDSKKGIRAKIICCQRLDPLVVYVPLDKQIIDIYGDIKITKKFLKQLTHKINLELNLNDVKIKLELNEGGDLLLTPLRKIFTPNIYGVAKVKYEPLVFDGKVRSLYCYNNKTFLICKTLDINYRTNELMQNEVTIDISNTIDGIFERRNLIEILKIRSYKKKNLVNAISRNIRGTILDIEYDELAKFGAYKLFTNLEDSILQNNNAK